MARVGRQAGRGPCRHSDHAEVSGVALGAGVDGVSAAGRVGRWGGELVAAAPCGLAAGHPGDSAAPDDADSSAGQDPDVVGWS